MKYGKKVFSPPDGLELILASGSPRRSDLLKQLGLEKFSVEVSDIDESINNLEAPKKYAARIALKKAETIKQFPGMKQPAIMPPESSRAGETYKRSFAERHGFDPYAGRGFVPNYATISNDMRDQGPSGMKLFVSPGFTTKGRPPPKSWDVQSNLAEFDEFLLPITKNISHNFEIFLTALCLFVVA